MLSQGGDHIIPEFEELFDSAEAESDVSSAEVARMLESVNSDSSADDSNFELYE